MFGAMLIFAILCMYCVDASRWQATVDSKVQQVEVAEQELIKASYALLITTLLLSIYYYCSW
jgi:hypothetical protein